MFWKVNKTRGASRERNAVRGPYRRYQIPRAGEPVAQTPGLQVSADGQRSAPFDGFFERQLTQSRRARLRRRILLVSIGLHGAVFGSLAIASLWQADELWSPTVAVTATLEAGDYPEEPASTRKKSRIARTSVERALGVRLRAAPGVTDELAVATEEGLGGVADGYLRAVTTRVRERLVYPPDAIPRGLAAGVTLRLSVGRSGALVDAAVQKPCPHEVLCAAALASARAATPLPAHDGQYGDPWLISIPIDFRPGRLRP